MGTTRADTLNASLQPTRLIFMPGAHTRDVANRLVLGLGAHRVDLSIYTYKHYIFFYYYLPLFCSLYIPHL